MSFINSCFIAINKRLSNLVASEDEIKGAYYRVRRELKNMKLLSDGSRLDRITWERGTETTDLFEGAIGVKGFYYPGQYVIHIPAFCSEALNPYLEGRCINDVMRHEFGHALQDVYPEYFNSSQFKAAFGGPYGTYKVAVDGDEANYVSAYARAYTQEDFAETFMHYLKHYGVLPMAFSQNEAIKAKWQAVDAICRNIVKL